MKAFLKGLKMTIDGKEPWLCARTSRWRRSTFQLEKSKETNVRYHLESDFSGLVYNLFDECQNIHLTIVYTSFENMCQTTPRSIEMYLLKENVAYSTLVGTGSDLKTLYKDNRGHIHFMRTK